MSFHLLAYNLPSDTASGVNTDFTAVPDPEFTSSGSTAHYKFSEDYYLLAVLTSGGSLTRGRILAPTINAIGELTIFNVATAIQPQSNYQFDNYIPYPLPLPKFEEIQYQMSNTGAGSLIENGALVIAPPDWNANVQRGKQLIQVRASFTVTPTLNAWSGGQAITLSQALRGGVYSVVGAQLQGANSTWFRLIFPRMKLSRGRRLRPGWYTQTALAQPVSLQLDGYPFSLGEWGRFWTNELPQCEVFGAVAGSITYQLFLWLQFLGEDENILTAWASGR